MRSNACLVVAMCAVLAVSAAWATESGAPVIIAMGDT
jgi:hypothetical protein